MAAGQYVDKTGCWSNAQAYQGTPQSWGHRLQDQDNVDRTVLSEYHDGGSPTGMFMLRSLRWKYNVYPGYPPELFDMIEDPDELIDLGGSQAHVEIREQCHGQMLELVDPLEC